METLSDAKANWHGQTSEPLWRLSWSKLRSEQYCANITWKHFTVVLFTSFLPSLFDFGTDYLSGVNFLSGTNYTKYVNHGSDFGTCTHTGRYTSFVGPRPEVLYEEISCFDSWQNLGLPYHRDHFSTWISFCLVDKNWNHETKELPSWKLSPHPFSPSRAPLPTFRDHAQGRCSLFQWKWTKEIDNRSHCDGRHLGINSSIPSQPVHHHYKTWSTSVMDPTSYPGHLTRGDCQNCHRRVSLQKTSHNCLVGFRASIYSLPCAPFPVEHLLQAWLNRSCCLASKVLGTPDIPRTCHLPMGYSSVLKQTESNLRQFPCHARPGPSTQGHR